jgi:glycosyltransferase involved in cell wall biosynthesis
MRIAFLDQTAKLGGGEMALLNLVTRLDSARFEPVVVLFSDGPLRDKLEKAGVRVIIEPLHAAVLETRKDSIGSATFLHLGSVWQSSRFVWRLSRLLRREHFDAVHTNSLKADILGGIAARIARLPVIWHVRDRIEPDYLPRQVVKVFRVLARRLPTSIVANSHATLKTLRLKEPVRGHVIYSGIDVSETEATAGNPPGQPQGATTRAAAPVIGPVIGLVGRIAPWKGQHIFIRAASIVRARFPDAKFLIIGEAMFGESAYEQNLKDLADRLALGGALQFLGFRDDVPTLIQSMDILVHASTTGEPFGQVIVQGMAAGKPVVATNGGGVPEIVLDGVTGLLVPMGNAEAMACAILSLLERPAVAAQMGRAARQRAQDCFAIERTVEQVQALYASIAVLSSRR